MFPDGWLLVFLVSTVYAELIPISISWWIPKINPLIGDKHLIFRIHFQSFLVMDMLSSPLLNLNVLCLIFSLIGIGILWGCTPRKGKVVHKFEPKIKSWISEPRARVKLRNRRRAQTNNNFRKCKKETAGGWCWKFIIDARLFLISISSYFFLWKVPGWQLPRDQLSFWGLISSWSRLSSQTITSAKTCIIYEELFYRSGQCLHFLYLSDPTIGSSWIKTAPLIARAIIKDLTGRKPSY